MFLDFLPEHGILVEIEYIYVVVVKLNKRFKMKLKEL